MTKKEVDLILKHVEKGGLVKRNTCYVDGFCNIYEDDDGIALISSEVWAEMPLEELPFHEFSFYKEVFLKLHHKDGIKS